MRALYYLTALGLSFSLPCGASAAEIKVMLFGQPCALQGPLEASTLKTVHEISPEQVYPSYLDASSPGASLAQAHKSLERLQKTKTVPAGLDLYRERTLKRLSAQIVFLEALEKSRKNATKSTEALDEAIDKTVVNPKKTAELKAQLKKNSSMDQLFDAYNNAIEPDAEEEFHRAIRRMGVQYACTFEDHNGSGKGGPGDGDE